MSKRTVVYLHRRNDNNEVFYVGIGDDKRPFCTTRRNQHWTSIVNKHGYTVEIFADNLCWEQACQLEIMLIARYGRRDQGEGTLVNHTDGGDGVNGYRHSNERIDKIRKASMGNTYGKGIPHTLEARKKISDSLKDNKYALGYKHTEETRKKISDSLKGNKYALGYKHTEETKLKCRSGLGKRWITNGVINKRINKEDKVPCGFRYGKLYNKQK